MTDEQKKAEANKALVRDWVEALSTGDSDRVCGFYSPDLEYYVIGDWPLSGTFGRDYMERNAGDVYKVFPEGLAFELVRLVGDGDWVCLEMRSKGLHVSGRIYANHYTYWIEVRDGKFVKLREWLDTMLANEVLCGGNQAIDFEDRRES